MASRRFTAFLVMVLVTFHEFQSGIHATETIPAETKQVSNWNCETNHFHSKVLTLNTVDFILAIIAVVVSLYMASEEFNSVSLGGKLLQSLRVLNDVPIPSLSKERMSNNATSIILKQFSRDENDATLTSSNLRTNLIHADGVSIADTSRGVSETRSQTRRSAYDITLDKYCPKYRDPPTVTDSKYGGYYEGLKKGLHIEEAIEFYATLPTTYQSSSRLAFNFAIIQLCFAYLAVYSIGSTLLMQASASTNCLCTRIGTMQTLGGENTTTVSGSYKLTVTELLFFDNTHSCSQSVPMESRYTSIPFDVIGFLMALISIAYGFCQVRGLKTLLSHSALLFFGESALNIAIMALAMITHIAVYDYISGNSSASLDHCECDLDETIALELMNKHNDANLIAYNAHTSVMMYLSTLWQDGV